MDEPIRYRNLCERTHHRASSKRDVSEHPHELELLGKSGSYIRGISQRSFSPLPSESCLTSSDILNS